MPKNPHGKHQLNNRHRAFLVEQFACFASVTEAQKALRQEFGIEITLQSCQHYDPTKVEGSKKLAKQWVELFERTREAFLKHTEEKVPECHKAVRLQELARIARKYKAQGNHMAQMHALERIAKEVGGAFTNRREFTGKDGQPIQTQEVPLEEMTVEQLEARVEGIVREVVLLRYDVDLDQLVPRSETVQ